MKYLVITDYGYEGCHIEWFDTRCEADEYLHASKDQAEDMTLVEYTQTFDVGVAIDALDEKLNAGRRAALGKLTLDDQILLGLTKA